MRFETNTTVVEAAPRRSERAGVVLLQKSSSAKKAAVVGVLFFFVVAAMSAGCGAPGDFSGGTSADAWTTHQDPAGFALDVPAGWRVSAEGGRVTAGGPGGEWVSIYPTRLEGQLDAQRAHGVLMNLSSQFWPQQQWVMPRAGWQFGTNGMRAVGADESNLRATTALWWANTPQGGAAAFFYAVAAPPARFAELAPVFARVLGSFRVTGAGGGPQAGASGGDNNSSSSSMQFTTWTDPTENAFSLEVPAGWRVSGGIQRTTATGRKSEWVIQSPDGQITVRSGDFNLPTQYIEPTPTITNLGYSEGQMYQNVFLISRYMPAVNYASWYAPTLAGQSSCGDLRWVMQKDRPDYIQNLARQSLLMADNRYTAGEVAFTCGANGQNYVGYLFAQTNAAPDMGVATIWSADALYGFLAPADQARTADAVLQRALSTLQVNPKWLAAERGMNARMAEDQRRYREWSANLQQQTQNERWASWDRIAEQRGDVLRGQTRVVDPETGQAYKTQANSSYYWIDPTNNVIAGTDIPSRPTWDFREMVQTYR